MKISLRTSTRYKISTSGRPSQSCIGSGEDFVRVLFEMFFRALMIISGVLTVTQAKHIKGIQIKNRGMEKLWVEMTDEDGFYLPSGQLASIVVEDKWTGRIRAHPEECGKKTCNLPYTEAVLRFEGEGNEDRYYVSVIEGFNRPIKIQPTSHERACKPALCHANINHHCPRTHQSTNSQGAVVACKTIPELFQRLCPQAITAEADIPLNMLGCRSNTYLILIG
ncbi:thaumatin-like protein 1a [Anoplophora glabripennis]|uniref:thaumatin-like protein 1a n=1 Tax=Anoplophora glabripennis TaxID=217634 RepID=UPI000874FB14|nr:thaumatin-like protein 1a [Anoplophora glabripennis]XP_018565694.1 thaumatin-like protein 1a [Anoplophora glabripennis]